MLPPRSRRLVGRLYPRGRDTLAWLVATLVVVLSVSTAVTVAPASAAPLAAAPAGPTGPAAADGTPLRGLPTSADPDFIDVPARCRDVNDLPRTGPCWVTSGKPRAPIVFLWGDSHAWMMTPAVHAAVRGKRVNLVLWFMGGCPPGLAPPTSARDNGCDESGRDAMSWVATKVAQGRSVRVVFGTSWELYRNAIAPPDATDRRFPGYTNDWIASNAGPARWTQPRAIRALNRLDVPVDLLAPMPMVWLDPPECSRGDYQCDLPRWGVLKHTRVNNASLDRLRRMIDHGGRVIRPSRALCGPQTCRGRLGGVPVYLDMLHIGQRVSAMLSRFFLPTVTRLERDRAGR